MFVSEDSKLDWDIFVRVAKKLHLQLDFREADGCGTFHWFTPKHFLKDVRVLDRRTVDLVYCLTIETT